MVEKPSKYELVYERATTFVERLSNSLSIFFNAFNWKNCRAIDLGGGQGRDALFIARKGHSVFGVDLSETGVHPSC